MASLEETLRKTQEKKKPFKKKAYRSYLDLDIKDEPAARGALPSPTALVALTRLETAQIEITQSEISHPETTQNETAQRELTHIETTQFEASQIEIARSENTLPKTAQNEHTQTEVAQNETARVETAQIESSQHEQSQIETAQSNKEKVRADFREISPTLEERYLGVHKDRTYAVLKQLDGDEFKILMFMTIQAFNRGPAYELGEGKARAALKFVSDGTNIPRATAARVWKRLQEQGYLKVEVEDQRNGFIYRVSPVLYQKPWKSQTETAQNETAQNGHASSLKESKLASSNRDTNKESSNKKTKSLSQERPSAWIEFTAQLTEKGRERAERVFQNLKNQFPADPVNEIAEAPKNLERFGAPDGTPWGQISSPIGLMESSWPQLREFFRKRVAETLKSNHARERIEAERIKAEEQDRLEAEQSQRRREAFFVAFQDEQGRREVIHKYLVGLPFKPDGQIGQNIAIAKWWEERTGAQQVTQGIMTSERERAEIRAAIEQSIGEGKS